MMRGGEEDGRGRKRTEEDGRGRKRTEEEGRGGERREEDDERRKEEGKRIALWQPLLSFNTIKTIAR